MHFVQSRRTPRWGPALLKHRPQHLEASNGEDKLARNTATAGIAAKLLVKRIVNLCGLCFMYGKYWFCERIRSFQPDI